MPSIPPEGFPAYKVLRKDFVGDLYSLFPEHSLWNLEYPRGMPISPSGLVRGIPTVWMFVFQTYQQADAYFQRLHLNNWSAFVIWRVRIFEEHLPAPKLVLAPGEIATSGQLYWTHWWSDSELNWLIGQGIKLIEPPIGTRVCSKLQLEAQVR
jgi:hypothetical protein